MLLLSGLARFGYRLTGYGSLRSPDDAMIVSGFVCPNIDEIDDINKLLWLLDDPEFVALRDDLMVRIATLREKII